MLAVESRRDTYKGLGARDILEKEARDGEGEGLDRFVGRVDVRRCREESLRIVDAEQNGVAVDIPEVSLVNTSWKRSDSRLLSGKLVKQSLEHRGCRLLIRTLGCQLVESSAHFDYAVTERPLFTGAQRLEGGLVGRGELGEELKGEGGLVEEGLGGGVDMRSRRVESGGSYRREESVVSSTVGDGRQWLDSPEGR